VGWPKQGFADVGFKWVGFLFMDKEGIETKKARKNPGFFLSLTVSPRPFLSLIFYGLQLLHHIPYHQEQWWRQ
jgi:hypothetical protein